MITFPRSRRAQYVKYSFSVSPSTKITNVVSGSAAGVRRPRDAGFGMSASGDGVAVGSSAGCGCELRVTDERHCAVSAVPVSPLDTLAKTRREVHERVEPALTTSVLLGKPCLVTAEDTLGT